MKLEITRISPLQTAKVLAVIQLALSFPMVVIMSVPSLFLSGTRWPFPMWFMVVMPFLYAVLGFFVTLLGAWIYNVAVEYTGGIQITAIGVRKTSAI